MATLHAIGHVAVMTTAVSRRPPLLPWEAPLAPRSSLGRQNDRILDKMASIWTRLNAAEEDDGEITNQVGKHLCMHTPDPVLCGYCGGTGTGSGIVIFDLFYFKTTIKSFSDLSVVKHLFEVNI